MKTVTMMTTASTAALIVGTGQSVFAQDGLLPAGYSLNVQGGYGVTDNALRDKIEGSSEGPEGDELTDKAGDDTSFRQISGSVSLTRQVTPQRDYTFGLSGSVTATDEVSSTQESGGDTEIIKNQNRLNIGALDFEAGYTMPTGGVDIRGFAGVRALATSTENDKFGAFDSGGGFDEAASFNLSSSFAGIGPRVGIGLSTQPTPVGNAGNFSFSGEVAASYLFGKRDDEFSVIVPFGGGDFEEQSEDVEVTTLELQLGVNYHLSPNAKVTVGYELMQLWNVDTYSDGDSTEFFLGPDDDDGDPRLVQGVFIGFTTNF